MTRLRRSIPLQRRIALHLIALTTVLLLTCSFIAWWVFSEVEDEVLDRYLVRTLPAIQHHPTTASWLESFTSSAELRARLTLADIPEQPGWFTVFASEDGRRARWIRTWQDRAYVWWYDLEVEYRVVVQAQGARRVWILINFEQLEHTEDEVSQFQVIVFVFIMLTWSLVVLFSARLARSAMAPIVDLTNRLRMHHVSTEQLAASCSDDEVGMLARALDDALARERALIEGERRFIADCSHELRTPLSIFRGTLGLLASQASDDARRAELLARLDRSAGRLESLSHTFLVMAREGRVRGARSPEFLVELLREAIMEQQLIFPHRALEVRLQGAEDATVDAQRDVLFVLFRNIVGNTFQHSTARSLDVSWLEMPSPHIQFIEGPTSSSVGDPPSVGFGIGLPLVRRLVDSQGWRLVEGHAAGGGLQYTIWFDASYETTSSNEGPRRVFGR